MNDYINSQLHYLEFFDKRLDFMFFAQRKNQTQVNQDNFQNLYNEFCVTEMQYNYRVSPCLSPFETNWMINIPRYV